MAEKILKVEHLKKSYDGDVYKRQIVFLVFTLLYTPCVAAITSVKRELGGKWAIGVVALQCGMAWIIAFLVNLILIAAGV